VAIATAPPPKPKLTSAESGVLVASNQMSGDLLKDTASPNSQDPKEQNLKSIPSTSTSLVSGTIPAGTKVKAAFANPLTWVAGDERLSGQRVLLRLKEDLGTVAPKGSTAIGEVITVQADYAQVQIVEINGRPIDHVNLRDPEQRGRTSPIAVVQHKEGPYLQAKVRNSNGSDFGSKLLRAGLNMGVDQLRDSGIADRAASVASSLIPDRRDSTSRGSDLYSFEGKDVEIYFLEGV
jgi:hypothetical protein